MKKLIIFILKLIKFGLVDNAATDSLVNLLSKWKLKMHKVDNKTFYIIFVTYYILYTIKQKKIMILIVEILAQKLKYIFLHISRSNSG